MRCPSMLVGPQPCHSPVRIRRSPSASRRDTARISAMVMSAVSSVSTPGVLVTRMPRSRAVARSIWSTPVPKDAISRRRGPAWASTPLSMRSVTVGTSTSADLQASISSVWLIARSSRFRRVSNSSIIRVSIASGSFRVTTTTGFCFAILSPLAPTYRALQCPSAPSPGTRALPSKRPRACPAPDLPKIRRNAVAPAILPLGGKVPVLDRGEDTLLNRSKQR